MLRRPWFFLASLGIFCLASLAIAPSLAWAGSPVTSAEPGSEKQKKIVAEPVGEKPEASGILAKYKSGSMASPSARAAASNRVAALGLKAARQYRLVPGLVRLGRAAARREMGPSAVSLQQQIKALRETGMFEYVEPDWPVRVLLTPSDAAFVRGDLWGLRNNGQDGGVAGVDIDAENAWNITTGSDDVIVGVIDTGIRHTHRDLVGNMWTNPQEIAGNGIDDDGNGYVDDIHGINAIDATGNAMDDNNHGTHVAGTIAASANDAGEHVGVAFNVRLMALKFLAADGSGTTSDAIACIEYAIAKGVDVLNNSWGGGGYSQALNDAIAQAYAAGVVFLAAAGNDGADNDITPSYPANIDQPNVVSVAAIDRRGNLASFSNYGASTVDLAAPGVAIYSTTAVSDTAYDFFNGTSMATPHVSGVAALLKSRFPNDSVESLVQRMMSTTTALNSLQGNTVSGGMVDAHAALSAQADGVFEMDMTTAGTLSSGQPGIFYLRVSDILPVLGASVSGSFDDVTGVDFLDDGLGADLEENDGIYTASYALPNDATDTLAIQVAVTVPSGTQSASFSFTVVQRPDNDDFNARGVLPNGSTSANGSNRSATREAGEPTNPSTAGGRSVWWEWVAPSSASHTLSTTGSNFDTTLAVYSGSSLDTLSLLGANDDFNGLQSAVTITAQAGQAYLIQVDGYAGAEGDIELHYPAPDSGGGAPVIVTQPRQTTVIEGEPAVLSVSVQGKSPLSYEWFKDGASLAAPDSSTYRIDAASETDTGEYHVVIRNALGSATSNTAFLQVDRVGIKPGNDAFADALVLSGAQGQISGQTQRATGEPGEPNHCGSSTPLNSLWYRWTAPGDGVFTVDTYGSNFDTVLAAYSGSRMDGLQEQSCNDDDVDLQSAVRLTVSAGEVVSVAVDGYSDASGELLLNYRLESAAVPVNNDFGAALTIVGNTSLQGDNINGDGEIGEPDHAGVSAPLSSSWWRWTAPDDGKVEISTLDSDFDTVLAAYRGDTLQSLSQLAANDDTVGLTSRVRFAVSADTAYHIAVDGYGAASGHIALALSFEPLAGYTDRDGDGMADDWEELYGLDPDDPSDALLDPDGDGIINREEYRAGSDPVGDAQPNAAAWLPAVMLLLD